MSTIEKLFVQIFDRRDRVLDRLKQQNQSVYQHLASKLLLDGITPPPWLLSSSDFHHPSSTSSDLIGLNKEELISGLLLPRPNRNCSWYTKQATTASSVELPENSLAGTSAPLGPLDEKHCELQYQHHLIGAEEVSHAAATPQDHPVEGIGDIYFKSDPSLARLQRSRSRQKALELRNSAKSSVKSGLAKESNPCVHSSDTGRPPNHNISESLKNSGPSPFSLEHAVNEEVLGVICMDKIADGCTGAIIPTSRCLAEEAAGEIHVSTDAFNANCRGVMGSSDLFQGSTVADCPDHEKGDQVSSVRITIPQITGTRQAETEYLNSKVEVEAFRSGNITYSGRITRSRSSAAKKAEVLCDNDMEMVEAVCSRQTTGFTTYCLQSVAADSQSYNNFSDCNSGGSMRSSIHEAKEGKVGDPRNQEKEENGFCGKTTRSGRSCSNDESGKPNNLPEIDNGQNCTLLDIIDEAGNLQPEAVRASGIQSDVSALNLERDIGSSRKDIEGCNLSTGNISAKNEQHLLRVTGSQSDHGIVGIQETIRSSNVLGKRAAGSRSTYDNPRLSRLSIEQNSASVSDTVVDVLDCLENHAGDKKLYATVASGQLNSSRLADSTAIVSGSNFGDSSVGKEVDARACSPWKASGMPLNQNQLDFVQDEDSCSHEVPDSALRTICQGMGSNMLGSGKLPTMLSLRGLDGRPDLVDDSLVKLQDISCTEKQHGVSSTRNVAQASGEEPDCHPIHPLPIGRDSDVCGQISSSSLAVEQLGDAFCLRGEESGLSLSKTHIEAADPRLLNLQVNAQLDLSSREHVHDTEGAQASMPGACDTSIHRCDANPAVNLSLQRHGSQLEAEQEVSSMERNVSASILCVNCEEAMEVQEQEVDTAYSGKRNEFGRASSVDLTPAFSGNETEVASSIAQHAELLHPYFSSAMKVANCSRPTEAYTLGNPKVNSDYNFVSDLGVSWPQLKRRKIGSEILSLESAGTRLKEDESEEVNDIQNVYGSKCILKLHSAHLPVQSTMPHLDFSLSSLSDISGAEAHQNLTCSLPQCSPDLLLEKDKLSLGGDRVTGLSMLKDGHLEQSIASGSTAWIAETKDSFAEGIVEADNSPILSRRQSDILSHLEDKPISTVSENLFRSAQTTLGKGKSVQEASIVSPQMELMDIFGSDHSIPVFESFMADREGSAKFSGDVSLEEFHLSGSAIERASFLEQLCRSATLNTPLSHFASEYQSHKASSVDRSLPTGLLEKIDLSGLPLDACSGRIMSAHCLGMNDNGSLLPGKLCLDSLPVPTARLGWDCKMPYMSPVSKSSGGISSKSGGSDKLTSSNPELTCFPIEEDVESHDECTEKNDLVDTYQEKDSSKERNNSVGREPLRDIAAENIILGVDSAAEKSNSECISTESTANEMPKSSMPKSGKSTRHRHKILGTDDLSLSMGGRSAKKNASTIKSRLRNPNLSGSTNLRSEDKSFSERENKCTNIVSNMKSFLPLVQQKKAAALESANRARKRDTRVKALEAAEAARRLEEKKENERKKKKEAFERARSEQDNLRQKELQKKLKEEERRKRDAEKAAKKRQREDEERKEKEKKRVCVDDAQRLQRELEGKLQVVPKDYSCIVPGEGADDMLQFHGEIEKHGSRTEECAMRPLNVLNGVGISQIDAGMFSGDYQKASTGSCDPGKMGSSEARGKSTPIYGEDRYSITNAIQEQSYEISPYQCSDDEDEEEDDKPNKKFMPAWGSKSAVAVALSALQNVDPDVIFTPGSFCSLEEVLLPRKLQQKH